MQDRIEKTIELKAPLTRVWRALTDHEAFGVWFCARLDRPFVVGETVNATMTLDGCDNTGWSATVTALEPQTLFAYTWAATPGNDGVPPLPATLVEFRLTPVAGGTRLHIRESGFSALPEARRRHALLSNTKGWEFQAANIAAYLEKNADAD